jgi:hypothetical protein
MDRQSDQQMGRTKTPVQSISVDFRVGNYAVIGLGNSVSLAPRLRKEYRYTSTDILGNYGLLYFEHYLLPGRNVRRSLLQYIT